MISHRCHIHHIHPLQLPPQPLRPTLLLRYTHSHILTTLYYTYFLLTYNPHALFFFTVSFPLSFISCHLSLDIYPLSPLFTHSPHSPPWTPEKYDSTILPPRSRFLFPLSTQKSNHDRGQIVIPRREPWLYCVLDQVQGVF